MTQWGRKYQPFRGGSGAAAYQFIAESTAVQNSWTEIGKGSYLRVINNRAMLDSRSISTPPSSCLKAQTDKTPIIDDVTFLRPAASTCPASRRISAGTTTRPQSVRHQPRHEDRLRISAGMGPRFTSRGAWARLEPPVTSSSRRPTGAEFCSRRTTDRCGTGTSSRTTRCSSRTSFSHAEADAQLRRPLRSVQKLLPEQRFGLNGNKPCVDDNDCDFAVRRQDGHAYAPRRDVSTTCSASCPHLRPSATRRRP